MANSPTPRRTWRHLAAPILSLAILLAVALLTSDRWSPLSSWLRPSSPTAGRTVAPTGSGLDLSPLTTPPSSPPTTLALDSLQRATGENPRVAGGSMSPTLRGARQEFTCVDCGFPVVIGQDQPVDYSTTCPNCGHPNSKQMGAVWQPGEAVRIQPLDFTSPLKRGTIVVLQQPDAPDQWAVKRLVGLPGDVVALRDGDCYVNGQIWRQTWDEFSSAAILVHDDRFRPPATRKLPPRWETTDKFQTTAEGYEFAGDDPAADYHWLRYRHLCCYFGNCLREQEVPIRDSQPLHQDIGRRLQIVRDLGVTCQVRADTTASVMLEIDNGREAFRGEISVAQRRIIGWRQEDGSWEKIEDLSWTGWDPAEWHEVGMALCDQQWLLVIDGEVLAAIPYEVTGVKTASSNSRPCAIGAQGAGVIQVRALQMWRDRYWLHPDGTGIPWEKSRPLGADEYFVLGDNPAVSMDSRQWLPGSVTRQTLRGTVQVVSDDPRNDP
ncbi:MAG: S26 family signal peptidase [Planctomycetota bacterium]